MSYEGDAGVLLVLVFLLGIGFGAGAVGAWVLIGKLSDRIGKLPDRRTRD